MRHHQAGADGALHDGPSAVAAPSRPRAEGAARPPRRRTPRPRTTPERVPELAHLTLSELRAHRQELTEEENRVSYWRRLVQARQDLLSSPFSSAREPLDDARLRRTLSTQGGARRRQVLLDVVAHEELLPVPDLETLWNELEPGDDAGRSELLARLARAEDQLSKYRTDLHRRLDRATSDLIARYHADPSSCLVALPRPR